ncbi:hypothetical protein [Pleionea sp. CnH1-48]|uniref:hypothetical protein n=1 Tax=Pleionea sp. CnH1-48 TaxID=2954494 RepID=UPI00209844CB|nr:hypothetical protein [Pleionea sp. CnH1-48]MCO7224721.1 hypothetical protein [Pleionea sp. CnH1-48]
MNKLTVRLQFREMLGEEKYIKFLSLLIDGKGKRLLYWQEKAWERFQKKFDYPFSDYEHLLSIFEYCHVHNVDLQEDTVEMVYGTVIPPSKSEQEKIEMLYPHVNLVAYGPCWEEDKKKTKIKFCHKCREVYALEKEVKRRR